MTWPRSGCASSLAVPSSIGALNASSSIWRGSREPAGRGAVAVGFLAKTLRPRPHGSGGSNARGSGLRGKGSHATVLPLGLLSGGTADGARNRMSIAVKPNRRRRSFAPLTELRAERLRHALTLFEIAQASGICSWRVSIIERALDQPTAEELAKLREAIGRLAEAWKS